MIRAVNSEEVYWAVMASYSESLKAGVTTANDMFYTRPPLQRTWSGNRTLPTALTREARQDRQKRPPAGTTQSEGPTEANS